MPSPSRWPDAVLAGLACSMRTTAGPALLAARGSISGKPRVAVLMATAGEFATDKLPIASDRIDPPAVGGRMASAAYTGHRIAGAPGAVAAAAAGAVGTLASWRLRGLAGQRTGLPDPLIAVGEDAIALGAAAIATRPDPEPDAAGDADPAGPSGERRRASLWRDAGVGLLAGVVATATMTIAEGAALVVTGGKPSTAPARVADTLKRSAGLGRLRRRQRPAANQAMHWLYGTAWGLPYGVIARRVPVVPEVSGPGFGLVVWAAGLAQQPALGVADPPWRRSPRSLATEAALHLVYGIGAGGALRALAPGR